MKFATYSLFPVLPFTIVTNVCATSPLLPVHPMNVYPGFTGLFNVIFSLSTVYVLGFAFPSSNAPPFRSYVILYVIAVLLYVAFTFLFSVTLFNFSGASHPANVYVYSPVASFVGSYPV